jgi:hypothetical protein
MATVHNEILGDYTYHYEVSMPASWGLSVSSAIDVVHLHIVFIPWNIHLAVLICTTGRTVGGS